MLVYVSACRDRTITDYCSYEKEIVVSPESLNGMSVFTKRGLYKHNCRYYRMCDTRKYELAGCNTENE